MQNRTTIIKTVSVITVVITLMFAGETNAESGKYNLHLELGPAFALTGWQAKDLGTGVSAAGMFELALNHRFGLEAGVGYTGFSNIHHPEGYKQYDSAGLFTTSVGLRFRIFNDEEGYLKPWRKTKGHKGNFWGNVWSDIRGNYVNTGGLHRFGMDVGLGAEASIVNGLQLGPFTRCTYIHQPDTVNKRDSKDVLVMVIGLSVSIAVPPKGMLYPDSDGDGIFEPEDNCPNEAEDKDGFEDADGCPDGDNDGDKIADVEDACPNVPEDQDGFKDEDGCPERDNDSDGIMDSDDECPVSPEDLDGFQDADGCPDTDNDKDEILDSKDQCPNKKETRNGFQDEDGCPEVDTDQDGIVDSIDECLETPETVNGVDDTDGCPDEALVEVRDDRILGGDRIFFDFAMVRIKSRSAETLVQLAKLLETHPEYAVVSIEGHADIMGSVKFNRKLSVMRGEQVKKYLIQLGVPEERLVVVGHGEKKPIAGGMKDEYRAKNRRVEFRIKKLNPKLATNPIADSIKDAVDLEPTGNLNAKLYSKKEVVKASAP